MGNKDFDRSSNLEAGISDFSDNRVYPEKRLSEPNGYGIHSRNRSNRSKMGEVIKTLINSLGFTTILLGILANIDNALSVLIAMVALGFALYKLLNEREVYLMKKMDREERKRGKK
jgi:hypothetical protein